MFWIFFLTFVFFTLKIKNQKRIFKLFKFIFKIVFSPLKLISFLINRYLKKKEIQNKLIAKEELKRKRIEIKIKSLKDNLNKA
jgi:hypothetical protein